MFPHQLDQDCRNMPNCPHQIYAFDEMSCQVPVTAKMKGKCKNEGHDSGTLVVQPKNISSTLFRYLLYNTLSDSKSAILIVNYGSGELGLAGGETESEKNTSLYPFIIAKVTRQISSFFIG